MMTTSPKMRVLFCAALLSVSVAPAAVDSKVKPATVQELSPLEILSLPEQNREAVVFAMKDAKPVAEKLMALAFDSQQAMPVRWKALTLGALVKGANAKADLTKALKSDSWYMRNAALLAMVRVFPVESRLVAKSLLNDKALVVRSAAVRVLATQLDLETRDLLWAELEKSYNFKNKESLWIRGQIVEALARAPEKRESPIFAKTLRDPDSRLHFFSIAALEKISNKKLGSLRSSISEKRELWLKAKL